MTFPLEKILTINAEDYCKSIGKTMVDYRAIGIHGTARLLLFSQGSEGIDDFMEKIPDRTEVIVNYTIAFTMSDGGGSIQYAYGTALIPK